MAIGKVAAEQTRKSKTSLKDDLRKEMFESNEKKLSAQYYKKVLLSGENGAGKTSLAMYLLLHNIQDDEMIFYINVDGSGPEIADNFYKSYYDSRQLRIIDASVFEENEKGVEIKNEETDENVKTQELLDLLSVSNVLKSYKAARRVGERRKVSKKEFKKKKAKRRMVKKSKK